MSLTSIARRADYSVACSEEMYRSILTARANVDQPLDQSLDQPRPNLFKVDFNIDLAKIEWEAER